MAFPRFIPGLICGSTALTILGGAGAGGRAGWGDDAMRIGLLTIAAALVGAVCLAGSVGAQSQQFDPTRDCTRSLAETAGLTDTGTRAIADGCRTIASRQSGVRAARARFYAGRARTKVSGGPPETWPSG